MSNSSFGRTPIWWLISAFLVLAYWITLLVLTQFVLPVVAPYEFQVLDTLEELKLVYYIPPILGVVLLLLGKRSGYYLIAPHAIVISALFLFLAPQVIQDSLPEVSNQIQVGISILTAIAVIPHLYLIPLYQRMSSIFVPQSVYRWCNVGAALLWSLFGFMHLIQLYSMTLILESAGSNLPNWLLCALNLIAVGCISKSPTAARVWLSFSFILPLTMTYSCIVADHANWRFQLLWLPIFIVFTILNFVLIIVRPVSEFEDESFLAIDTAQATP